MANQLEELLWAIVRADSLDELPWMAFQDYLQESGLALDGWLRQAREHPFRQGILSLNRERYRPVMDWAGLTATLNGPTECSGGMLRVSLPAVVFTSELKKGISVRWPVTFQLHVNQLSELQELEKRLRAHPPIPARMTLSFSRPLTPAMVAILESMPQPTGLKLQFEGEEIGVERIPAMPQLQSLILSNTTLTTTGMEALTRLRSLQSLVLLHLHDPTEAALRRLTECSLLRSIILDSRQIVPTTVLADWTRTLRLQRLSLGAFDPLTTRDLECLQQCPTLRDISFAMMNLAAVRDASPLLHLPKLERLDFMRYRGLISPEFWRMLSELPRLVELNLAMCETLREKDLESVAELPALRVLHLHDCQGLGAGIIPILARMRQLEELDVRGCTNVRPREWEGLRRALPRCQMVGLPS
ncbi:leucine-rich repeat domain-containing protein [Tuwongella immobilis]|uniref:Repeat-companion domain protein n=1 Tax=Tuwongella immobilis TaxID=692036 RepID=A0A6C2YKQ8_9BACT|nr:hypothetical protein [Tuwongella immobilis]VIP01891.1 Uncharacterized protein OS=Phytophthora ramorum PE=4 SV=1: LRR_6 [Tuwongella immobilis]VTR99761.1 Uncharacterized protein OS=Phytophthora ramorum PE=4 SV=1: LRR_6 [Tuwongella immobilis]